MLVELIKNHSPLKIAKLTRNFSREGTVLTGMTLSQGKFAFIMDDELQNSPYDFNKLLEKKEHDVVIADFFEQNNKLFKGFTSRIKG